MDRVDVSRVVNNPGPVLLNLSAGHETKCEYRTDPAQPATGARRSDPGNNALVGPAIRTDPTLARLLAQPGRLG